MEHNDAAHIDQQEARLPYGEQDDSDVDEGEEEEDEDVDESSEDEEFTLKQFGITQALPVQEGEPNWEGAHSSCDGGGWLSHLLQNEWTGIKLP